MKLDADDPKLTAYALNELDGAERAEVEALLANDEAGRKAVEEIRASAQVLTDEFKKERIAGLTEKQQHSIHEKIAGPIFIPTPAKVSLLPRRVLWTSLTIAASLLFVVGIVGLTLTSPHREMADEKSTPTMPSPVVVSESPNAFRNESFESYSESSKTASEASGYKRSDTARETLDFKSGDKQPAPKAVYANPRAGDEFVTELKSDSVFNAFHGTVAQGDQSESKMKIRDEGRIVKTAPQPAEPATRPVSEASGKIDSKAPVATEPAKVSALKPAASQDDEITRLKHEIEVIRSTPQTQPKDRLKSSVDKQLETHFGPSPAKELDTKRPVGGFYYDNGEKNDFKKKFPPVEGIPAPLYNNIEIPPLQPAPTLPGGETYPAVTESSFKRVTDEPLSTFSIDVDTASYANVRRYLNQGQLPPRDAVRIEEMLNYFSYNYGQPTGDDPFAIHVEIAQCPWNTAHRLARVGIKGREFAENQRPASNLVFLIDVSGSMSDAKRLPLVQAGLNMLVDKLSENDRVGIVIYAGESGIPLTSTPCSDKAAIKRVINSLKAAGSTNGGEGIQKAYQMATANFIKGGINRVVLCTDGDFNVGVTNPDDLVRLVEAQAKTNVFLSVLGFGMGNLKDATMQKLADKGNGNYAYIDSLDEVRKVLVDQMTATLATIAKDVKVQVEFNPAQAGAYRLIGYEKRLLAKQDFNNDKVDAGEVGAGHQVTALYEIVPAGAMESEPGVDPLIYQKNPAPVSPNAANTELLTLKIRYKQPEGETSKLIKGAVSDSGASYTKASKDFKFAAAVAAFGMILRESPYRGNTSLDAVLELAEEARGKDEGGYRREFLGLVEKAKTILKK